ncbi:MAG TPA: MDR family oxidoreductase [Thermoanaerobaculia bacterium]|nr:MDR family oxidoreductase [Thermoanaerobaculia bacterium]
MAINALVARENAVAFETLTEADLPKEGVLLDVAYSSLNYKDGLAVTRKGKIVRRFPMVLGIDIAGTTESGERVLGTGQGLGEAEWGGYAQRQRVPADAVIPVPEGMSFEQAMQLGTAGFTAMLCVMALEQNNVLPSDREVIVTGAAGGVGSIAVMLLAKLGYRVAASTGRPELEEYLRGLGATSIVPREELATPGAPMQKERWAGGVDTVGGATLANVYAQTVYEGAVACCGMAASHELDTTVWPLILRNVSFLGVSSLRTSRAKRIEGWSRLARDVDFGKLASLSRVEPLSRIFELSNDIMEGNIRGRVVIDVNA